MCLLLFAHGVHPDYPLVVLANRDEFHRRPTAAAQWWAEGDILAGRDLEAGGTWMGVSLAGRFAAVTNYRDPASHQPGLRSRGAVVVEALRAPDARGFLDRLRAEGGAYNGFNLVLGEPGAVWSFGNRGGGAIELRPGLYGLSNHLMETPWPKVVRGKRLLQSYLESVRFPDLEPAFELLGDRTPAPEAELPETGVGLEWERRLAPMFIVSPSYGTRASTILLISASGQATFAERSFGPDGRPTDTRVFPFHTSK